MSDVVPHQIDAPTADGAPALPALAPAGAWRRFLARLFDMWWQLILIGLIVGVAVALFSPRATVWMSSPGGSALTGIVLILLGLLLDAMLMARFGATPGKYLLGVRVETVAGQPLSLRAALRRNLGVWALGLGLTIPIINLVAMGRQGWRVGEGRPASYDEGRYRVLALPLTWRRRLGFVLAALALLLAIGMAGKRSGNAPAKPAARATGAAISWTNPETGQVINIAPGWRHEIDYDEDGKPVHRFMGDNGRAAVLLSYEAVGPMPFEAYVRTVRESLAQHVKLDGRSETFMGVPSWAAENFMDNPSVTRVQVRALRHGDVYWRLSTLQDYPYRDSDRAVAALNAQLWSAIVTD